MPFWDDERGSFCRPTEFIGGSRLCIAGATDEWIAFADAECTVAIVARKPCEAPPELAISDADPFDDVFSVTPSHVYGIAGPFEESVAYVRTDLGCEARNVSGDLWRVGDELAPTDALPVVVDRIE